MKRSLVFMPASPSMGLITNAKNKGEIKHTEQINSLHLLQFTAIRQRYQEPVSGNNSLRQHQEKLSVSMSSFSIDCRISNILMIHIPNEGPTSKQVSHPLHFNVVLL